MIEQLTVYLIVYLVRTFRAEIELHCYSGVRQFVKISPIVTSTLLAD